MTFEYREQIGTVALAIFLFSFQAPAQINVALQLTHPSCGGFSTGSILAIPIGGMGPYTYDWSNGSNNNPITFIPAGEYTVTVTDTNGSTGTAMGTITEPDPLQVQIAITDCGVPGSMQAVVNGGIPPFEYEWSSGESTSAIYDLMPDQYCLTVTDLNSCAFQLCESIGNPMSISLDANPAICGTGEGGNAAVNVFGGVAPFDYLWSNGETTDSISNLPPGIYSVTVTAENGCTAFGDKEVDFITGDIPVSLDIIHPNCTGINTGQITANPSNGVIPYIYDWSNGDTTQTLSNLTADTYFVTITDFIGCSSIDSATLQIPNIIDVNFDSIIHPTCHYSTDGYLEVSAQNGEEPYLFVWSTGDSIQYIDTLGAGMYYVTVTDILNCMTIDSFELIAPDTFKINIDSTEPSFCGANDGTITALPMGGVTGPFKYLWSTGDTTKTLTNIGTGTYEVSITSSEGCEASTIDTLLEPIYLTVNISGSDLVCHNEFNSQLTANTAHGTAPYTYLWSNGNTEQSITGVGPGDYSVTIFSAENCKGSDTITVIENPPIMISGTVTHVTCFGQSNGSININVEGGTPPLNILWPNGSNSTILTNLQAGNFTVTVTDAEGCEKTETFIVTQPQKLEIEFSSSAGSCGNNGFSMALPSGGVSPYQFLWNTGDTDELLDNIPPGTYTVTITDSNGCTKANSVIINSYPGFSLDVPSTNTTCNGTTDGTASVVTFGGSAPFSYLWSTGQTTNSISGLSPGVYEVTVTDGNDCTETASAIIEMGSGLNVFIEADSFICLGGFGAATATGIGGNSNSYIYNWSTGESTETINNLIPGDYSVTVSTPEGCSGEGSFLFVEGGNFNLNSSFQNIKCFGDSTGSISVNATGGIPPFTFNWSNGATTSTIQNLPVGNYTVSVSDFSECVKTLNVEITSPPEMIVDVLGMDGICGNLGSASSEILGGTMPFFYQWSNGATTPSISILGPNTYSLTVTDANNCSAVDSTEIDLISSVSCSVEMLLPVTSAGGNNGSLNAAITDGIGPYTFNWSNGKTTQSIDNLPAGNYTVTVTDSNDCVSTCNFFLLDGAQIGDFVWEDSNENGIQDTGEEGLVGVEISLSGTNIYGLPVNINTASNTLGNYFFDVSPGEYQLTFSVPIGYVPSPKGQGGDIEIDSDADPLTNKTNFFSINAGDENHQIDAGFYVEINCDNVISAGDICCNQILCGEGNTPTPLMNNELPSGGSGALEYVWMYSEMSEVFDPLTWLVIDNSNLPSLDLGVVDTTTFFVRRARRNGCTQFIESNIIEVTVNEIPTIEIIAPSVVCQTSNVEVSGTDYGADAIYTWTFENGNPAISSSPVVSNLIWDMIGDWEISYAVEVDGCLAVVLDTIQITESPDYCGYELVLDGAKIDTATAHLNWLYPESDTVDRNYTVEWAWENEPFTAIGQADSMDTAGIFIHFFRKHNGMLVGKNAYRVILDDSDGTQLVSNIVEFQRDSIPVVEPEKEYRLVHSYPNPFTDLIKIDVYDRFDVPVTIELFNPLGQLAYFDELSTDMDTFEIDTKEFPSGTYFMFVRYGGKPQKIFKFVKGQ